MITTCYQIEIESLSHLSTYLLRYLYINLDKVIEYESCNDKNSQTEYDIYTELIVSLTVHWNEEWKFMYQNHSSKLHQLPFDQGVQIVISLRHE